MSSASSSASSHSASPARTRASRGATWTRKHVAHAQRCPSCYTSLAQLAPVAQSSVDIAELAARLVVNGDVELTSRALARARDVSVEYAGQLLRRAEDDGLVRRARVRLAHGGGSEYRYWPTRASVAYMRSSTLAAALPTALSRAS